MGAIFLSLLAAPLFLAQQQLVFDVGNRSQLFIDQLLVHDAKGVSYTLHPAKRHPHNPLMKADRPWEGIQAYVYGSVLFDEDDRLFKMWYTCSPSTEFKHEMTCYATSKDGIVWEKPLVGTIKSKSGRPTNVVADCQLASVFKDRRETDPERRYKMVCYIYDRGYLSMVSPDGLRWREASPAPIVPVSYVDDVVTAIWDERTGQYVAFPKLGTPVFGRQRRSLYVSTSRDFKHWSKMTPAFLADRVDDLAVLPRLEAVKPLLNFPINKNVARTEFYGTGAFAAECGMIAFPWVFSVSANIPKYGNQDGPIDIGLAFSRDLETWSRPLRSPILPLADADQWDSGMLFTVAGAIQVGDEVRLYYSGINVTHGAPVLYEPQASKSARKVQSGIGLATWKRDRFVSIDASAQGGSLTTVPIKFRGNRLEINAVTKAKGEIVVEMLDTGGRPIEGVGASERVVGDDVRHQVSFGDKGNVGRLAGETVRLRFRLREAQLFSFAFRE